MLMVIFGAGASYDSSPDFPPLSIPAAQQNFANSPAQSVSREQWRPPLANGLFDNRGHAFGDIMRNYYKLSHIFPLLRQRSAGKTVEEVLEQLQEESKDNPEGLRELTSVQYYLRDLFALVTSKWLEQTDRITNYNPLIRDILRLTRNGELVCLVTFNYDLLLDDALFSYGYEPQEPEDQFQSHQVLKLFKPHGSVDWARKVLLPHGEFLNPYSIIEAAGGIQLTSEFKRLTPSQADVNPGRQTFFPVIAVPFQNKTAETFEWPPRHLTQLQDLLPSVTKILIIGWRAREAHFIELLRNSLPRVSHVMVVGSGYLDAAEILAYFAESTALVKRAGIDQSAIARLPSATSILSFKRDRILDAMPDEEAVELSVAPGGFSDFALNRRVIDFLKA